jgi:two-component system, NtrC family, sensor histidine kinase HydH
MENRQRIIDLTLITSMVILITLMHYHTSYTSTEYHAFSAILYFIPIIYAAFRFGLKGGAVAGLLVSIIYAPYLIWNREHLAPALVIRVLDVLLYNGIGWITGALVEAEHKQKRRYLQAVGELKKTNQELEQKIREKSELEEQVRRADKLSALGLLVSGVAHELRNPLGILKATVQVMEAEVGDNPTVKEFTGVVKEEADRMNNIIQEFLDFARPSTPQLEMVDINTVLHEVLQFTCKYLDQRNITISKNFDATLPPVCVDRKQMRQVFINLILNGAAAIQGEGTITVTSGYDARYLLLKFSDTGCGIPPENLGRIFDPFFTTKDTGTGLGLAVVHRIIDSHTGFIEVDSSVGQGTEFTIHIPLNPSEGGSGKCNAS